MSWLFKSLQSDGSDSPQSSPTNRNGGVKEELSVLGENIGRQLRGVAAFLAPPPITESQSQSRPSDSPTLQGIRDDLVEIGGSFKSGLSLLSGNKAVAGFSKLASNLLQFRNQDDYGEEFDGVAGITGEVVEFVKEISLRSECWTDFPLSLDDDFEMSDAQREHAFSVERRSCEIPPGITIWKNHNIIATRNMLLQKLQTTRNVQVGNNTSDASQKSSEIGETQEENIGSREKDVTKIVNATKDLEIEDEENTEQWLEEDDTDTGFSVSTRKEIHHEEDVSFSDLEDESNDRPGRLSARRSAEGTKAISPSGSSDWVQLQESSMHRGDLERACRSTTSRDKDSEGESSDWLAVDDFD
ncbi:BSD domain-containing protein [Citrus sinensis]|uniref:BSD domain-containing protein n=1 Tax=Citrus sinensis TaxID=2711 RepID=A0ACB8P4H4_CITSI|nr:BSD domain-containing protein [Citrus sinensis]